jgi:hypothetical protein
MIVGVVPIIVGGAFQHIGLGFTDGTEFSEITFENATTNAATLGPNISVQHFNSTSSFNIRLVEIPFFSAAGPLMFWKIRNDGTNLTYSCGPSPYDFVQLFSEGTGAFLGAITSWGFMLDGNTTQSGASQSVLVAHTSFGA